VAKTNTADEVTAIQSTSAVVKMKLYYSLHSCISKMG